LDFATAISINQFPQIKSPLFLPAITDSISCDILRQLLVPIYNWCALQITFEKRIAVGRASCHSYRIESFGIADCVWQSALLFKRAGWRLRACIESLMAREKFGIGKRKMNFSKELDG